MSIQSRTRSPIWESLGQDRGGGAWSILAPSERDMVAVLPHSVPHPPLWLSCFAALGLEMDVLELLTVY